VTGGSLIGQRVAVTGAGGQLGRYLVPALAAQGATVLPIVHCAGSGIDHTVAIEDADAVRRLFADLRPDSVVHAAAWTDVDGCERDPERAFAANGAGARNVALAAGESGAYLLAVGTDFVFPGNGGAPYAEDAVQSPLSVYGSSKLEGEVAVLETDASFAVARTAWVFGGAGKHFPRTVLTVLRDRGAMEVVDDECGNPTFAGDLAEGLVKLLASRPSGRFHLTNTGRTSRFELARRVAALAGFDPSAVSPTSTAAFLAKYPLPAKRPADSSLANIRAAALGVTLPRWEDALIRYIPSLAAELGLTTPASGEELETHP
jgi:dTDP-4-dehydrorhamnose reductase